MSAFDSSHAAAFLECMAPGEQLHTFQTFHDREKGQPGAVVHGTLQELAPYLVQCQQAGHGVFWTVNRTDGHGRELANVRSIRALWLDLDDPSQPLPELPLPPHCVVQSSPGKHHVYWRVSDCLLDQAQPLLRALRQRWGGDPGATGINRVLRVPGFWHLKGEPCYSQIVQWQPQAAPYTVAQIVAALLGGQMPQAEDAPGADSALHEGPVEGWRSPISDTELLARLNGQSKAAPGPGEAFGARWTLHELWAPDMHALEARKERSEARMALLTRLMYLTGGDSARVHALVEGHPLAVKDGREGLLLSELGRARRVFLDWWEPEHARRQLQMSETREIAAAAPEGVQVTPRVMGLDDMLSDLVYVGRGRGVVVRSTRQVFKFEDAAGWFAASKTEVPDGERVKRVATLPLWLAHEERRLSVGLMTWRPSEPEFCEPMDLVDGHQSAYNTWRGLRPMAAPDNWREWSAWFEYHVAYLVPVERERRRFLQWLAHIFQRPGELPHTGYLMVTKTTGTGRNWLASVLARCLAGYCALGVSLGPILDGKFNGILSQKLLATVDEVREGVEGDRYGRGEALKKIITEERRQIDHKYGMQVVEQNCCRWLILSNHDDGLPIDNTDRRLIVVANPAHRMDGAYYAQLYQLLGVPAFVASVRRYLETLDLTGFNPGEPAPMNEAKARAIESLTSNTDKAVRRFAETWPAPVATLRDLRAFIQDVTGESPRGGSLRHAMQRVGVVDLGASLVIQGVRESVLQIRAGEVSDAAAAIIQARGRF